MRSRWRSFYRGGNYNNGAEAGLFYGNLNNPRSNQNDNLGFRPLYPTVHRDDVHGIVCQMLSAYGLASSTPGE